MKRSPGSTIITALVICAISTSASPTTCTAIATPVVIQEAALNTLSPREYADTMTAWTRRVGSSTSSTFNATSTPSESTFVTASTSGTLKKRDIKNSWIAAVLAFSLGVLATLF